MVYFSITNRTYLYCYVVFIAYMVHYKLPNFPIFFKGRFCLLLLFILLKGCGSFTNITFTDMTPLKVLQVVI